MTETPMPSELVADLAERMGDGRHRTTAAYNAIVALRSMPVEQRMLLAGMRQVSWTRPSDGTEQAAWVEPDD